MLKKNKINIFQISLIIILMFTNYSCDFISCYNVGAIQDQEIFVEEACWGNVRYDMKTECDNLHAMVLDYAEDCGYEKFNSNGLQFSGTKYTQGIVDTILAVGECCTLFFQNIDYQEFK